MPNASSGLIRSLFAIQLISMGAMEMSGPFWPIYLRTLSDSDLLFGFGGVAVYVGPMIGIALTGTFWGRLGDRYGHKLMMVRALVGLSVTQLGLAYAGDIWTILALRFVQGACAGYIAPAQAYGVSIEAPDRRARLFAFLQVSTNVGSLMGAVFGGLILDHASFFWINIVASALCAACAVAAVALLPAVAPAPSVATAAAASSPAAARTLWRDSPVPGLLCVLGLLLLSRLMPQMPFSLYVSSVFAVDNWIVGLCYGLLALGFIVSATPWARHFEQRTRTDTLSHLVYVALACAAVTALAGATRDAAVFLVLYFAWGVLLGATTPVLTALISREAGSGQQGYVLGLTQSTAQFSSIAGIALGGWLSQAIGLSYTYFFVAIAYLATLLPLVLLRRASDPVPVPGREGSSS